MSQPPNEQYPPYPQYPPYTQYPPYGYFAPYPPPAPPRRASLTWLWITLSIVGGLLIVCCILPLTLGALLVAPLGGAGTFHVGTPTTPTVIARPVSGLAGATLGGTLNGFQSAYGAATLTSDGDASWDGASITGRQVALYITLATGQDGNLHVTSVQASPVAIGEVWDSQTALKVMAALFPSDTQTAGADTSDPNALINIYTSAMLGQTLLPAQAASAGATPTLTGEFNVACQRVGGSQISYCFLVAGAP